MAISRVIRKYGGMVLLILTFGWQVAWGAPDESRLFDSLQKRLIE